MKFTILENKEDVSFADINALTEKVGWGKNYFPTSERWLYTLEKSTYIAYLKKDHELIGFVRILEDGQMCMIYDMCVHPDYQKQNLGTALMQHLINKIKDQNYVSIGLFAWSGNQTVPQFYSKFGFEQVVAMELKKYMKKV